MIVRLTPRVVAEIDDIADYSMEHWGEAQTRHYMAELNSRFEWLAHHPKLGRSADQISPTLRRYRQGSHLIFYREIDGGIEIIGVPHQSMDIDAYFDADDGD